MSQSTPLICKDCWPTKQNWNAPCEHFAKLWELLATAQEQIATLEGQVGWMKRVVVAAKDHQTARRYGDAKDRQEGERRMDEALATPQGAT